MIKLVDYGVGNIQAFMTLFKSMGLDAQRAQAPQELEGATHLVLPGVGHFDHAMQRLNESGMRPMLEEMVTGKRVPVLGVCVGMQMLAPINTTELAPGSFVLFFAPNQNEDAKVISLHHGLVFALKAMEGGSERRQPTVGWSIPAELKLYSGWSAYAGHGIVEADGLFRRTAIRKPRYFANASCWAPVRCMVYCWIPSFSCGPCGSRHRTAGICHN